MSEKVIIIGAGGHGRVVADIVEAAGDTVAGFLDDAAETRFSGAWSILGTTADTWKYPDCRFVIAVGNNAARKKLAERLDLKWYTAVHPSAVVSPSARLGEGTVVMPRAVVNSGARVGRHAILNTACVVEHDNVLGDFVHLSPAAALGGTVSVGEGTHIGIGACVCNNVSICAGCVVGAGAAVIHDIGESGVYVGVPVRRL